MYRFVTIYEKKYQDQTSRSSTLPTSKMPVSRDVYFNLVGRSTWPQSNYLIQSILDCLVYGPDIYRYYARKPSWDTEFGSSAKIQNTSCWYSLQEFKRMGRGWVVWQCLIPVLPASVLPLIPWAGLLLFFVTKPKGGVWRGFFGLKSLFLNLSSFFFLPKVWFRSLSYFSFFTKP